MHLINTFIFKLHMPGGNRALNLGKTTKEALMTYFLSCLFFMLLMDLFIKIRRRKYRSFTD